MIEKAKRKGSVWENFGQKELRKLKDKYDYTSLCISDDCLTPNQIKIRNTIDELDNWASTYSLL